MAIRAISVTAWTPARGKVQGNGSTSKLLKHTFFAPFFFPSPFCLYLDFGLVWEMVNSRAKFSFVTLLTLLQNLFAVFFFLLEKTPFELVGPSKRVILTDSWLLLSSTFLLNLVYVLIT